MKKKILIPLIIVILLVVILFGLQTYQNSKVAPATDLKLPKSIVSQNITNSLDESKFNAPATLNYLEITRINPLTKDQAKRIAQTLNFTGEPLTAEDVVDGTKYIWSTDEYSLSIAAKQRSFSYIRNETPPARIVDKQLTDAQIETTAKNAIAQIYTAIGETQNNFRIISSTYFVTGGSGHDMTTTTKQNATLVQVNFSPQITQYPILTLNPNKPLTYVWVRKDDVIHRIDALLLDQNSIKIGEEVQLKNFQETINSLSEAVIISLDDGNLYFSSPTDYKVESINIESLELGYLYDDLNKSSLLYPIYILKGEAEITNVGRGISVHLYLPATK